MAVTASFNANSLNTFDGSHGIIVNDMDYQSTPNITANLLPIAKAPRSSVTSVLKQQKVITLSGDIVGTSIADCTTQINTFKGFLVGTEKVLTVSDGTNTLNYVCTVSENIISRPGYLVDASFKTTFICSQPYGYENAATTVLNQTGRTTGSFSDSITVGGNAEWQTPVITITLTAVTGGTGKFITIGNDLTGQACTVTRTWASADVLVIDTSSITHPVQVNGADVVFTGALPTFNPTAYVSGQKIDYTDNFTTRTFTELVQNTNRWD